MLHINKAMDTSTNQPPETMVTSKVQVPDSYVTGTVWSQIIVPNNRVYNNMIKNVIFEPGARMNWHINPGVQILIVTDGAGYYQERSKPVQLLRNGNGVTIHPGIEHWYGACPDSEFKYVTIITNTNSGPAEWRERVTDEHYTSVL